MSVLLQLMINLRGWFEQFVNETRQNVWRNQKSSKEFHFLVGLKLCICKAWNGKSFSFEAFLESSSFSLLLNERYKKTFKLEKFLETEKIFEEFFQASEFFYNFQTDFFRFLKSQKALKIHFQMFKKTWRIFIEKKLKLFLKLFFKQKLFSQVSLNQKKS